MTPVGIEGNAPWAHCMKRLPANMIVIRAVCRGAKRTDPKRGPTVISIGVDILLHAGFHSCFCPRVRNAPDNLIRFPRKPGCYFILRRSSQATSIMVTSSRKYTNSLESFDIRNSSYFSSGYQYTLYLSKLHLVTRTCFSSSNVDP